jgi:hypothetical protein
MFNKDELFYIAVGIQKFIDSAEERLSDAQENLIYDTKTPHPDRKEYIADDNETIIDAKKELQELKILNNKIKRLREQK